MKKQGFIEADSLLTLICNTKEVREKLNMQPTFTTRLGASISLGLSFKRIDAMANQLAIEGKIRIGDTISDKYYELIEQNAE